MDAFWRVNSDWIISKTELYVSPDTMGLDVGYVFHATSDRIHIGRSRLTRGG